MRPPSWGLLPKLNELNEENLIKNLPLQTSV